MSGTQGGRPRRASSTPAPSDPKQSHPVVTPGQVDLTGADRVLRFPEVRAIVPLGRTTIWRMERDGKFPRRRQLSARSVGWLASEIKEWLATRQLVNGEVAP
jgi:prophage regulatory protein